MAIQRARVCGSLGSPAPALRDRRMAPMVPWMIAPIVYIVIATRVLAMTCVAVGLGNSDGVIEAT